MGQYIVMTGLQNIRMAIWKDFCWFALGPPEVAGGVDLRDQTVVKFWSELPEAKEFQRHCRYLAPRYGHIPTFFL